RGLPRLDVDARLFDSADDPQHGQRRQESHEEQHAPRVRLGNDAEDRRGAYDRQPVAERPSRLNGADDASTGARINRLADEDRSHRPFAAEAESLQTSGDHQLREGAREAGQQRERREPDDRQLQYFYAPDPIRENPRDPSTDGRHY